MPATMNISLPENLKAFVDEQVESGGYGSASEYVRELVRRDQKERAEARLETLLLEGIKSGMAVPANKDFWADVRRDVAKRRAKKKKP